MLLSASPFFGGMTPASTFGLGNDAAPPSHNFSPAARGPSGADQQNTTEITFDLLPTDIQTGLTSLASTDGDTAPTSTTEVHLANVDGVETYTIQETGTGTSSDLTVDSAGNPVIAPSQTATTFGNITNTAVTDEITRIATAENLTAPTSSTAVTVLTSISGAVTYAIHLDDAGSSSSNDTHSFTPGQTIIVDANGNPAGNETVPFSVLSTAIQNGLTTNAPTGATALAADSPIRVQTIDGVTLYTADYSTTGIQSAVTVDTTGTLTSKPQITTVDFSTLPAAAQTELQSWATAEGVSTTIAADQQVTQTTEPNGSVLYTVQLEATKSTDDTTNAKTYEISLTVDASGNPTVLGAATGYGGIFGGEGFPDPPAFFGNADAC